MTKEKSITGGEVDLTALREEVWNGAGLLTEQAEMHLDRILNYLASRGHLKTTGASFEDRVRTALYPTGVKHPQQATTDNMIREIVMLVGLRLKTTGEDEKGVEWVSAPPHGTYEGLLCQFRALKTMINSMGQQISSYSKKDYSLSEKRLAGLQASLDSERAMNAKLTEELDHLASTGRISGWLPIESAPRDGTMFYTDKGELAAFIVARQRFEYWRAPGHKFIATHWMPLPQPPEVKE